MRTIISFAVCLALLLGCVGRVQADNLYDMLFSNCAPNCIRSKQCDDYCPKGLPCTKPVCDSQCDDYRPKKLPCTRPVCAATCDDYCGKALPKVCCPQTRCAPSAPSCGQPNGSTNSPRSAKETIVVDRSMQQGRTPNQQWHSEKRYNLGSRVVTSRESSNPIPNPRSGDLVR
jgi:hypothetical protein